MLEPRHKLEVSALWVGCFPGTKQVDGQVLAPHPAWTAWNRFIFGKNRVGLGPYISADRIEPLTPGGLDDLRPLTQGRSRVGQEIAFTIDLAAKKITEKTEGLPFPGTSVIFKDDNSQERFTASIVEWSFPPPSLSVSADTVHVHSVFEGWAKQTAGRALATSFAADLHMPAALARKVVDWLTPAAGMSVRLDMTLPGQHGPASCSAVVRCGVFPDMYLALRVRQGGTVVLDEMLVRSITPDATAYGTRAMKTITTPVLTFRLSG